MHQDIVESFAVPRSNLHTSVVLGALLRTVYNLISGFPNHSPGFQKTKRNLKLIKNFTIFSEKFKFF